MLFGWQDNDKKRAIGLKLADAIERYQEKFDREPSICLVHPEDRDALLSSKSSPALELRAVGFVPRGVFYLGDEADCHAEAAAA